jgi:hypothetical protein
MAHLPSPDEILACRTSRGAWTRRQLAEWGVPWPPPRGWKRALESKWYRQNPDAVRPAPQEIVLRTKYPFTAIINGKPMLITSPHYEPPVPLMLTPLEQLDEEAFLRASEDS